MTQHTIPILNLADYEAGGGKQAAFVEGVGRALCEVGFFAVTNHGMEAAYVQKAYEMIGTFFALPEPVKRKYELANKGQRGFVSFGREHAKHTSVPDLKEFWHVGRELAAADPLAKVYPANVWPAELPEFKSLMLGIYERLEACGLRLLEACSLYLGEDKSRLRDIAVGGNSILRLIHYPPLSGKVHPESIRAQAHEDINLITLLIDATTSGLELMDRNGNWLPVVTPPGCIIVDAGDMLQNITNGFFKSTTHRVVNPQGPNVARYSMPFFMHARGEVSLEPMASSLRKTGEKKYPAITADEYLHERLREIGLG